MTSAGAIGIGTVTPATPLHVCANTAGNLLQCWLDGDDGTNDGGAYLAWRYGGTTKWTMGFRNQTNIGSAFALIVVDDDGNNGVYMNQDATSWTANSDIRIKENIHQVTGSLSKINGIRGVYYNYVWDTVRNPASESYNRRVGVIAQELTGSGMSDAVAIPPGTGSLGVSYTEIIPYLIESVKELTQAHRDLRAQITGSTDLGQLKASVSGSTFV